MKEFAKTVISREEIDFSFEEKQGYFVYRPLRKNLSDHIPGILVTSCDIISLKNV